MRDLLREIGVTLGAYLSGQARIWLILMALYTAGFALARVPAWYLMGPLCGVLHMVPVVGAFVILLIAPYVMWMGGGGLYQVLTVFGVCVVIQGFEGFYLTPKILGKRMSMPAWLVFIVVLLGGAIFGFLGVIFAVPAVAIALIIWKYMQRRPT